MKAQTITYFGRRSVNLENTRVRTVIDALGGMMPEFSLKRGKGGINAHWIPDFRDNSGRPYEQNERADYWKVKLLYLISGDFLASPNFGIPCTVDGVALQAHGWAANEAWTIQDQGVSAEAGLAFARFHLDSPAAAMPLAWDKCDLVLEDQAAYYSIMRVRNTGTRPIDINMTRHNTLGAPFLQAGCRISLSADRFQTVPVPSEFDPTGRLLQGVRFDDLAQAPLRGGGTADLTVVPGMIGATDFITGAIPAHLDLGWSCVVNPTLGLAYICFFPGAAGLPEGEIALGFNDLWMQYGGRSFTPWALNEGGGDRTFCLGTENAVGAYANGLEYARAHPELLGRSTLVTIPAGGERKLCYGVALVELDPDLLREGVKSVTAEAGLLVLRGLRTVQKVPLDARFTRARTFEGAL
jgi:hypothetical protein